MSEANHKPVVGLALGSGAARGWAHIGVIQELESMGIRPDVVAGCSIGSVVGAAYVCGELDKFSDWVTALTMKEVFSLVDVSFSGALFKGDKLFGFLKDHHGGKNIEEADKKFAAVATDMKTGREVWLDKGPFMEAARASCALPGILPAYNYEGHWLLDGGLVNPVPVSLCRALGAEVVIAVDLNASLMGRGMVSGNNTLEPKSAEQQEKDHETSLWERLVEHFPALEKEEVPGMFDALSTSVNIMQDRITRSRMVGEPPEVVLAPVLEDFFMVEFHRGEEAIEKGRQQVRQNADKIKAWMK